MSNWNITLLRSQKCIHVLPFFYEMITCFRLKIDAYGTSLFFGRQKFYYREDKTFVKFCKMFVLELYVRELNSISKKLIRHFRHFILYVLCTETKNEVFTLNWCFEYRCAQLVYIYILRVYIIVHVNRKFLTCILFIPV